MNEARAEPAPPSSGELCIPQPPGGGQDGPVRAVTLDLWHTLVYLEPEAEEAYMRAQLDLATDALASSPGPAGAAELGVEELRAAFAAEYGAAVAAAQGGSSVTPAQQLERAAARTGREVDTPAYLKRLHELVAATPFQKAPGALQMLAELRELGLRTAVISNTTGEPGAALRPVLRRLGFDGLLETFVFSDERPWSKPAAEIFVDALSRLGADPSRAVHVGDGWVDIEGARRAGFRGGILYTGLQRYGEQYRALFLPEGWTNPPAQYRVERLEEIPRLACRLLDGAAGGA